MGSSFASRAAPCKNGKFSAPGVPPTCSLLVQFSGGALAVSGSSFANETPEPSGATGQSPSTP